MVFFCCGSFGDVKQPTASPSKKNIRAIPTSSIRGSLIRTHDTNIEDVYYIDRDNELGKGGCGVVVIGEDKETHVQYAIKIVNKATAERGRLDRELKLLKDVDHTNIVRLFSVYENFQNMYFVMELCLGGHLGNLIARQPNKFLEEDWARRLCQQLLSAVAHIHSRGIAHRDIKLQNILIDCTNDRIAQIKLIDFGYGSRYVGNLPMKTKCGTPYTTAPEVIRENYDERCDVWSCGVVLYIMLCGRRPFEALDIGGHLSDAGKAAMITNILAGRYHFNHRPWQSVSRAGINFVKLLLHQDYRSRVRSHEALENTWLMDLGSKSNKISPLLSAKSFRAVSKLKQSQDQTQMQRTGMMAVVFGIQSRAATDLRAVFQSFDTDLSGSISRKEFHNAMERLAPELSVEDVDRLFDIIDIDKNQQLSFTEFLISTLDPREVDIEELNNAFRVLDEDGNGFITKDELRKVIRMQLIQAMENEYRNENGEITRSVQAADVGYLYNEVEQRVEEIFKNVDVNNDGKISRAEFLWAMTGSSEFGPRDAKLQRHKSVSAKHDPAFLSPSKKAASTSTLPVDNTIRKLQTRVPMLESSSKKTVANVDAPNSPPNFRGILARTQLQQIEANQSIRQSPRMEIIGAGNIAHYNVTEEMEPLKKEEEYPEENQSNSSYDADKVARFFGRPNGSFNNGDQVMDTIGDSFKRNFARPDRDTIYRMSEVEEEKSEFELSAKQKMVPVISFRNSAIIDGTDPKLSTETVESYKTPPGTFRTKLTSQHPSFKKDISAKFVDIATLEENDKDGENIPPLGKMPSRNFSVTSLLRGKMDE